MANFVTCTGFIVWTIFWANGGEIEKHKFSTRVLLHNKFFNKRISIIRCFKTHCQLSKFTIQDMPFKTKLTSLVNTRGLTESESLKIIKILAVTLGGITDLKIFGRCMWRQQSYRRATWALIEDHHIKRRQCPSHFMRGHGFLSASRIVYLQWQIHL